MILVATWESVAELIRLHTNGDVQRWAISFLLLVDLIKKGGKQANMAKAHPVAKFQFGCKAESVSDKSSRVTLNLCLNSALSYELECTPSVSHSRSRFLRPITSTSYLNLKNFLPSKK